jgi:formaldehyde-activating enzyme involved in methanogenesis
MNEAVEGCHIFPTPLRAVEVEINNGNLKKVYQYNSYQSARLADETFLLIDQDHSNRVYHP